MARPAVGPSAPAATPPKPVGASAGGNAQEVSKPKEASKPKTPKLDRAKTAQGFGVGAKAGRQTTLTLVPSKELRAVASEYRRRAEVEQEKLVESAKPVKSKLGEVLVTNAVKIPDLVAEWAKRSGSAALISRMECGNALRPNVPSTTPAHQFTDLPFTSTPTHRFRQNVRDLLQKPNVKEVDACARAKWTPTLGKRVGRLSLP